MSTPLEVKLKKREQIGHANTKLAPQGKIPAIVYGDKKEPVAVEVPAHEAEMLFQKHGENLVLNLSVEDGKPAVALVRDVQRHPISRKILHIDFMLASATKTVVSEVTVVLTGNPIGVREEGGILNTELYSVEIDALVKDIPEKIEADISELGLLDVLTAGDLALPANVKLATDPDAAICSIVAPAAEEEEEVVEDDELLEGEEGAEGEGASEEGSEEGESSEE